MIDDDAPGTMWSVIDIHISIICACLPSLPGAIKRLRAIAYTCARQPCTSQSIILRSSFHSRRPRPSLRIPDEEDDRNGTADTRWSQTTFAQSQYTTPTSATTNKKSSTGFKLGTETKCYSSYSANQSEPTRWSPGNPERYPERQLSWGHGIPEDRELDDFEWPMHQRAFSHWSRNQKL